MPISTVDMFVFYQPRNTVFVHIYDSAEDQITFHEFVLIQEVANSLRMCELKLCGHL